MISAAAGTAANNLEIRILGHFKSVCAMLINGELSEHFIALLY